jgi:hypothetical protein
MRCVITGHTRGLGKYLYDNFKSKNWEVIGLSSSNGYSIPSKIKEVIEISEGCDLFINNTFAEGHQIDILRALKYKVEKMVVCGSIARNYPLSEILTGEYVNVKSELAKECQLLSIKDDDKLANILHLDLGFLEGSIENPLEPMEFISDYVTEFNEVFSSIEFWLENPKIRQIEFSWKFTPFLETRLLRASNNNDSYNNFLNDLNK